MDERVEAGETTPDPGAPGRKVCRTCGEVKPVSEFAGCGLTADRLQPSCRPCHGAKVSAGWDRRAVRAAESRDRVAAAPPAEAVAADGDEWQDMLMLLVNGANTQTADAVQYFPKGGAAYNAYLGRVRRAFERLHGLIVTLPDCPEPVRRASQRAAAGSPWDAPTEEKGVSG